MAYYPPQPSFYAYPTIGQPPIYAAGPATPTFYPVPGAAYAYPPATPTAYPPQPGYGYPPSSPQPAYAAGGAPYPPQGYPPAMAPAPYPQQAAYPPQPAAYPSYPSQQQAYAPSAPQQYAPPQQQYAPPMMQQQQQQYAPPAPMAGSYPQQPAMMAGASAPGIPSALPGEMNPVLIRQDAEKLHYAISGLGTDDSLLIDIVGGRSRVHLQAVAKEYKTLYGHDLVKNIRDDTSFNYKKLLIGLTMPIGDYLVSLLRDAMDGIGTKEKELIDVLCQASPVEMKMLKESWKASCNQDLVRRIKSETSWNFEKVLVAVVNAERMPIGFIDMPHVETDARALYEAGEGKIGTNDSVFIEIFSRSSPEHLQAVSQAYQRRTGHSLRKAVKKETSGDYQRALCTLMTPRPYYWAKRIHDAIDGVGTNDSLLIRMFAWADKPLLQAAAARYQQKYKKSLDHAVKGDTSGDYKRLLSRLLH